MLKDGVRVALKKGSQGEALGHRALLTSELFAEPQVEVRNTSWQVLDISYMYDLWKGRHDT